MKRLIIMALGIALVVGILKRRERQACCGMPDGGIDCCR